MINKKFDKTIKDLYFKPEYRATPADKKLAENIASLEKAVADMGRMNYTPGERQAFVEEGIQRLKLEHFAQNEAARQDLEKKLVKVGAEWIRKNDGDPARAMLERTRLESRLKILSDDDLQKKAMDYIRAQGPEAYRNPDELEVLSQEIERRAILDRDDWPIAEHLRQTMRERVYTEPWRFTEEGLELIDGIEAHSTEFGKTHVYTVNSINIEGAEPEVREAWSELEIESLINV